MLYMHATSSFSMCDDVAVEAFVGRPETFPGYANRFEVNQHIWGNITALRNYVNDQVTAIGIEENADIGGLQGQLNAEVADRAVDEAVLQTNIDAEATTRASAVTGLQSQVTTTANGLASEISDRGAAISTLQQTMLTQFGIYDTSFLSILAVDSFGNTSTAGVTTSNTIDTTAPTPPSSVVGTNSDTSVTLRWSLSNDTSAVALRKSRIAIPALPTDGLLVTENTTTTNYTLTDLEDGTYYFSLFATDAFGNVSEKASTSVTVDAKPTLVKLVDRSEVKKGTLEITTDVTNPVVNAEIGKNSDSATVNIGATHTSSGTKLGVGSGSVGNIVISSHNASWVDQGDVKLGSGGGAGNILQSDGMVDISGSLSLGSDSTSSGNYSLSGGTLKAQTIVIGANGGTGTFDWTGGTLQTSGVIGDLTNKSGTLEVDSDRPVNVTGNYVQFASGTVAFTLKDSNPALVSGNKSVSTATPLLSSTGLLTISGTIIIQKSGYSPKPGDHIVLVNRSAHIASKESHIASIPTFVLPELDSRMSCYTSAFETEGTIAVVGSSSDLLASRPLNFPNPFKLTTGTSIGYWLNNAADIELRIYTATGSEVFRKSLVSGVDDGAKSGYNKVPISRDIIGTDLPSGVYPYILISNSKVVGKGRFVVRPQ